MDNAVLSRLYSTIALTISALEKDVRNWTMSCGVQQLPTTTETGSGAFARVVSSVITELLCVSLVALLGVCECDSGYSGESCDTIIGDTPPAEPFKEGFEKSIDPGKWSLVAGGSVGSDCGVVSSGNAMVFR